MKKKRIFSRTEKSVKKPFINSLLILTLCMLFLITGCGKTDDSGSERVDQKLKELQSGESSVGDALAIDSEKSIKTITLNKDTIDKLDQYKDDFLNDLNNIAELQEVDDTYSFDVADYKDVYSVITKYMNQIIDDTKENYKSTISYDVSSSNITLNYNTDDSKESIEKQVNTLIKYFALYQSIDAQGDWTVIVDLIDDNDTRLYVSEYDGFTFDNASTTDATSTKINTTEEGTDESGSTETATETTEEE